MRDIVLTMIVLGALPVAFKRPYIGVLVWTWLSMMNPHRLTWGFANSMPFAQIVAVPTLLGLLMTKERRWIPPVRETILLGLFWALTFVSTVYAQNQLAAWSDLERFSKILFMTFVMMLLIQDRTKLRQVLLVAGLSIGFYGLKGGIWGIVTGGAHGHVLGPDQSFIGDNNGLALALNMVMPILFFLAREEQNSWLKRVYYVVFGFSILGVLLTYSRAGFLGLMVVMFALICRSKYKFYATVVAIVGALVLGGFMSKRWFDRIESIENYDKDTSATSRLYAWGVAWQLALNSPLVGAGFGSVYRRENWQRYANEYYSVHGKTHNTHSIYFHALGEHGFTGFFLLMGILVSLWLSLRKIRRDHTRRQNGQWLVNYSYMAETSLAGYMVTGAFQNLLYFDLFYFIISVTVILKQLSQDVVAADVSAKEPAKLADQWVGQPRFPAGLASRTSPTR